MAHGGVEVDGLHRVAGQEVDDVEVLAQPEQVLVVGPVADPAAAVHVGHVGRAGHGAEGHGRSADGQAVVGVPGVEAERRGRGGDPLEHHVRVEAHPGLRRRRPRRRPRPAGGGPRRRGSPCRCRAGSAATRGGWPRARPPTRPRRVASATSAGPTAAARGPGCAARPRHLVDPAGGDLRRRPGPRHRARAVGRGSAPCSAPVLAAPAAASAPASAAASVTAAPLPLWCQAPPRPGGPPRRQLPEHSSRQ